MSPFVVTSFVLKRKKMVYNNGLSNTNVCLCKHAVSGQLHLFICAFIFWLSVRFIHFLMFSTVLYVKHVEFNVMKHAYKCQLGLLAGDVFRWLMVLNEHSYKVLSFMLHLYFLFLPRPLPPQSSSNTLSYLPLLLLAARIFSKSVALLLLSRGFACMFWAFMDYFREFLLPAAGVSSRLISYMSEA